MRWMIYIKKPWSENFHETLVSQPVLTKTRGVGVINPPMSMKNVIYAEFFSKIGISYHEQSLNKQRNCEKPKKCKKCPGFVKGNFLANNIQKSLYITVYLCIKFPFCSLPLDQELTAPTTLQTQECIHKAWKTWQIVEEMAEGLYQPTVIQNLLTRAQDKFSGFLLHQQIFPSTTL